MNINFTMPKLTPVPIPTKGKKWWNQLFIMLTHTRNWRLSENWYFKLPNGIDIVIPEGFQFDGASIPKPLYFLIAVVLVLVVIGVELSPLLMAFLSALFVGVGVMLSPVGTLLIAGLVHDYAYRYTYLWKVNEGGSFEKYTYETGSHIDYDYLFLKINLEVNGMKFTDYIASFLLAMFGSHAWDENRQLNAPEMRPKP